MRMMMMGVQVVAKAVEGVVVQVVAKEVGEVVVQEEEVGKVVEEVVVQVAVNEEAARDDWRRVVVASSGNANQTHRET